MDANCFVSPYGLMPGASLSEKWKSLRPIISRLYVDESRSLAQVMETVRSQYGFDANEHQYKYQIRQWKLKKNIQTRTKSKMCGVIKHRTTQGKTTDINYHGKSVDKMKLRRTVEKELKKLLDSLDQTSTAGGRDGKPQRPPINIISRLLTKCNMPYGALRYAYVIGTDRCSPQSVAALTPADFHAATPAAINSVCSPPADSPSGLSKALRNKNALERAQFFAEGKYDEMFRSMESQERVIMSAWLYQFWLFSYKTAKHWGRGPRNWTADLLDLDKHMEKLSISTPGTPRMTDASPAASHALNDRSPTGLMLIDDKTPTILCHWGVHLRRPDYDRVPTPPPLDILEDLTEKSADWPQSWGKPDFISRLRNGLENNYFSNIKAEDLPAAVPRLLSNARKLDDDLLEDALAFSIMGRNVDLLFSVVRKVYETSVDVDHLFPFHLATTYLCGSDPCCNVLCCLVYSPHTLSLRDLYTNDRGYTVLDNLMVAVLKSHTSCTPGQVDEALRGERRFAGQEVDICGRWDADSDEIRALISKAKSRIPFEWKHKFCHTSVQTICHCISILFGPNWKPDINTPSGLFIKRCTSCNRNLEILPLHTMVVVAYQLAQRGCDEEDLFGAIACLLCLLRKGANPLLTAELSAPALFEGQQSGNCAHDQLDPIQLAERVPTDSVAKWSQAMRTGWAIFCHVLRSSRGNLQPEDPNRPVLSNDTPYTVDFDQYIAFPEDPMEVDEEDAMEVDENTIADEEILRDCSCGNVNNFKGNTDLRDLWVAVQAEILSYRRVRDGDPWLSRHFVLEEVWESIEAGHGVRVGLIESDMVREHCDCGSFTHTKDKDCPCVDEVCAYYFSNIDDWDRTTYLECPERHVFRYEEDDEENDYDDYDDDDDDDDEEEDC